MSFKAKFKVSGKEYNVLDCTYSLYQDTDPTGRPSSITRGGKVTMTVESTQETDLYEWMCNSFETKDGSVVFLKRDSDATMKELKFKKGYIVAFTEEHHSANANPMTITFTISAMELTMGNGTHKNEWPI